MKTINDKPFAAFESFIDRLGWTVVLAVGMVALLLVTLTVSAREAGGIGRFAAPTARTAAEIEWNVREDLKAAHNVGLPGID